MDRLCGLVFDSLKPALRSPRRFIKRAIKSVYGRMTYCTKSRAELHSYWKQPWDGSNLPQGYLNGEAKSKFLGEIIKRYAAPDAKILEIGCNVGRNLNYLFSSGFYRIYGIEISENAVDLLKRSFPEMAENVEIYNMAVEEKIKDFQDNEFDTVFTMAVLEHIHPESKWIFPEMVRIAKDYLVIIENERRRSWRHFPRNYRKIFEPLGTTQVEQINCCDVHKLSKSYVARVFKKA